MKAQEILDKSAQYFKNAKGRAGNTGTNGIFVCDYLSPDGRRCVIGNLLPDDHPVLTEQSGDDVYGILGEYPELDWLIDDEIMVTTWDIDLDQAVTIPGGLAFLSDLQMLHDAAENWQGTTFKNWSGFRAIANNYGLQSPV